MLQCGRARPGAAGKVAWHLCQQQSGRPDSQDLQQPQHCDAALEPNCPGGLPLPACISCPAAVLCWGTAALMLACLAAVVCWDTAVLLLACSAVHVC